MEPEAQPEEQPEQPEHTSSSKLAEEEGSLPQAEARLTVVELRQKAQVAVAAGRLTQQAVDATPKHFNGEKSQLRRLLREAVLGLERMKQLRPFSVLQLENHARQLGVAADDIEAAKESEVQRDDLVHLVVERELVVQAEARRAKEEARRVAEAEAQRIAEAKEAARLEELARVAATSAKVLAARTQSAVQMEKVAAAADVATAADREREWCEEEATHAEIGEVAATLVARIATENARLGTVRAAVHADRAEVEARRKEMMGFWKGHFVASDVECQPCQEGVPNQGHEDVHGRTSSAINGIHGQESVASLDPSTVIDLNVGGILYTTYLDTLRQSPPGSKLNTLFDPESGFTVPTDSAGRRFIDRDGRPFVHVLNYLRDGSFPAEANDDIRASLLGEAEYFELPGLVEWCKATWTQNVARMQVCDQYVCKADARFTIAYAHNEYAQVAGNQMHPMRWHGGHEISVCGCVYDPEQTPVTQACLYHPGELQFFFVRGRRGHSNENSGGFEALWTCCKKISNTLGLLYPGDHAHQQGCEPVECPINEVPGCMRGNHGLRSQAVGQLKRGYKPPSRIPGNGEENNVYRILTDSS